MNNFSSVNIALHRFLHNINGNTLFARFCAYAGLHAELNSSVLITEWRVVIEKSVTGLPTK